MAIREGIYVEGHEIVERYVGNQLVWKKLDLITETTAAYFFLDYKEITEILFSIDGSFSFTDGERLNSADSMVIAGTLFTKITIKFLSYKYIEHKNENSLNFKLTFSGSREMSAFMSLLGLNTAVDKKMAETKFYKKRGK